MLALTKRTFLALALFIVTTSIFAVPNHAAAADASGLIRCGIYNGTWHGDKVKVIIEEVSRNGQFPGLVHFDPNSNWPHAKFEFSGQIGQLDSLTISRINDNCNQVANAGVPCREGRYWVWKGGVTGDGVDGVYPFELEIPR